MVRTQAVLIAAGMNREGRRPALLAPQSRGCAVISGTDRTKQRRPPA